MKPIALFYFLFFSVTCFAVVSPAPVSKFDRSTTSFKEIENPFWKKLSLLQKIKIRLILKALRKVNGQAISEKQQKQANASMILGISSIALLLLAFSSIGILALLSIPAAIVAIILGKKSLKGNSNTKGKIGMITGAIALGAIILYTILVLIFFTGFIFE